MYSFFCGWKDVFSLPQFFYIRFNTQNDNFFDKMFSEHRKINSTILVGEKSGALTSNPRIKSELCGIWNNFSDSRMSTGLAFVLAFVPPVVLRHGCKLTVNVAVLLRRNIFLHVFPALWIVALLV